ncbi:MAG: hypothetical protein IJ404_01120 [Clostridia bacterium]|nr:hypothetical protein [Clostridia bacterium]
MENEVKNDVRPEIEQTEGNLTVKKNKTIDFLAKVICLLLAFFLWYYAVSIDTVIYEEEFFEIPVEIVNNGDYSVLSGDGITVDVTLSGNRATVRKIKNSEIRAYVDVSNVTEAGEKLFNIHFELPNGVKLEKSSIESVNVHLDNKVSKTVSVEAKAFNYSSEYDLVISELDDIEIIGPEQIVSKIVRAELPVDLKNETITSGLKYSGKLILIGEDGMQISEADRRNVRLKSDTASVTVSLYGNAVASIEVVFKHSIQKSENADIKPDRRVLNVYGEIDTVENMSVKCVIDEKTLKSGGRVNCVVSLPNGVKNLDNVTSIGVTVTLKNFAEKEITVPVRDSNGTEIARIRAKFRGEESVMKSLVASKIKATVNIPEGESSGIVEFEFLDEFSGKVYEIYSEGSPYTVSVKAN